MARSRAAPDHVTSALAGNRPAGVHCEGGGGGRRRSSRTGPRGRSQTRLARCLPASARRRRSGQARRAGPRNLAEAAWWTGHLEERRSLRARAYAEFAQSERARPCRARRQHARDRPHRRGRDVGRRRAGSGERRPSSVRRRNRPRTTTSRWLAVSSGSSRERSRAPAPTSRAGPRAGRAFRRSQPGGTVARLPRDGVRAGRCGRRGLGLLDEATAAAVSGELEPLATGVVYCVTIDSCQSLGDCGRAAEWTEAVNQWCDGRDITGRLPGRVPDPPGTGRTPARRVAAGRAAGRQGVRRAARLQRLRHGRRLLRDRRDPAPARRFAAAEEAYAMARDFGREPEPGLALLRLAQGGRSRPPRGRSAASSSARSSIP